VTCSSDLSGADVAEGGEVEEEVALGERRLRIGNAAVVTCATQKKPSEIFTSGFTERGDRPHLLS